MVSISCKVGLLCLTILGSSFAWLPRTPLVNHIQRLRSTAVKMTATDRLTETPKTILSPQLTGGQVKNAQITNEGKLVEIQFVDGSIFAFHALWLRDSCRDDEHVVACAGERLLTATAAMISAPESIVAKSLIVSTEGDLKITWDGDETRLGNVDNSVTVSSFKGNFLRSYAERVAKPLDAATKDISLQQDNFEWLRPYTGYPSAKAAKPEMVNLWKNADIQAGKFAITTFKYEDANESNLDFLKAIMRDGIVLVSVSIGISIMYSTLYFHEFCNFILFIFFFPRLKTSLSALMQLCLRNSLTEC